MKQKRWGWQTWVAAGLLFLLCITIFLPGLKISESRYSEAVTEAKRYAKAKDSALEIQEAVENVRSSGETKLQLPMGGTGSITRLFLARWVIRVKNDLDFEGVELKENMSLTKTDVYTGLRLWGWLIYIPFLTNLITLIFVLCKGRPFKGALIACGSVTLLCEILSHFAIPHLLWSEGGYVIRSFTLLSEEVLQTFGTGEKFFVSLLHKCGGISWILVILAAFLLLGYTLVIFFLGREKESAAMEGITTTITGITENISEIWKETGNLSNIGTKPSGRIYGIRGEYAGQTIPVDFGEEIVMGRDARYCMLVFVNPKVSRKHCGIRYDIQSGVYQAIDYSSGGTHLADGSLLAASQYTVLHAGTVIYLANGTEAFMLT